MQCWPWVCRPAAMAGGLIQAGLPLCRHSQLHSSSTLADVTHAGLPLCRHLQLHSSSTLGAQCLASTRSSAPHSRDQTAEADTACRLQAVGKFVVTHSLMQQISAAEADCSRSQLQRRTAADLSCRGGLQLTSNDRNEHCSAAFPQMVVDCS